MKVAILGISSNTERYAYRAAQRLLAAGHVVFGVNPSMPSVEGVEVVARISELPPGIHTLTVYVSPQTSEYMSDSIAEYGFSRVIFNPGAEQASVALALRDSGVEVVEACTLVMLATGKF